MRLACDTGGTFTDLVVEYDDGTVRLFKSPTTREDPAQGVIAATALAAYADGISLRDFLGRADELIHGTTHAINAIITGRTARTAFLTTAGHPDILVLREGGRGDPFNHDLAYPPPYVPRSLTFEIVERIDYAGQVRTPLDEPRAIETIRELKHKEVEAVACCLIWSISNPEHELRIGALLDRHLPGIPYTLSHQLNPSLREFRRAISTAIDASLKPTMTLYLGSLHARLSEAGFRGRLFVQTSEGGMVEAEQLARTPIHSLNSGPALAPVAGRHIARRLQAASDVIVADAGGTTYDVTLIRSGRIPMTRESWIGRPHEGLMTGFPSIDVKSVGAGGGSLAWLDTAGLLRVGPQSAGAVPGPACFGLGGIRPTLTDAAVVLGYIDPGNFLGGKMLLDMQAARRSIEPIAQEMGLPVERAALAIYSVATENMVQAILDITVRQGIDPATAVLIGGGGAAGLNSTMIARRLGCAQLVIPFVGACLSAAGALLSDIRSYFRRTRFCTTSAFPYEEINVCLQDLIGKCQTFIARAGGKPEQSRIDLYAEARYPDQVWEIDVPFDVTTFRKDSDVQDFCERFHTAHREMFGYNEPGSDVEIVTWCAAVSVKAAGMTRGELRLRDAASERASRQRHVWFDGYDQPIETTVHDFLGLPPDKTIGGPAIIEMPFTTVVVDPAASFRLEREVGLLISPGTHRDVGLLDPTESLEDRR